MNRLFRRLLQKARAETWLTILSRRADSAINLLDELRVIIEEIHKVVTYSLFMLDAARSFEVPYNRFSCRIIQPKDFGCINDFQSLVRNHLYKFVSNLVVHEGISSR